MAQDINNYEGMMAVMEAYFTEQGLNTTSPSTKEEMITFLTWISERLPIIDDYITIKTN
jgi:hypothetical protein